MPIWTRSFAIAVSISMAACGEKSDRTTSGTGGTGGVQYDVCASDEGYTPFTHGMSSSNQGLTVTIESEPPVPSPGDENTWKLTVTDDSGAPVPAGTKVGVTCIMSHSGARSHGCGAPIRVEELGNGVYEATPVIFIMQGHWHVDFGIGTSYVPIELCVE